jgi:hypothetical protein
MCVWVYKPVNAACGNNRWLFRDSRSPLKHSVWAKCTWCRVNAAATYNIRRSLNPVMVRLGWCQASIAVKTRFSLLWNVMQSRLVVSYRRFGKQLSHQGLLDPWKIGPTRCPAQRVQLPISLWCVTSQKSEDFLKLMLRTVTDLLPRAKFVFASKLQ